MTSYAIIPVAFILGFALARASTCTVAATARLVSAGKTDWLGGLGVAIAWAGLTLAGLASVIGDQVFLPSDLHIGWQLVIGSLLMGIGAVLNSACFVGTIGKIGTGQFTCILTFVGLAAALWLGRTDVASQFRGDATADGVPITGTIDVITVLFALLAIYSIWRMTRHKSRAMVALAVVGVSAATIFGTSDHWSYAAVLDNAISGGGLGSGAASELAVAALFSGAIISSALKDRFHPKLGNAKMAAGNLSGGFLMGFGALAVPGGNDILLLWTIPGKAIYGVVAYAIMIGVIAMIIISMRRFSRG